MKVESLEFWETVKKEYDPKGPHYFICWSSKIFDEAWNCMDDKLTIQRLGYDFSNDIGKKLNFDSIVLFLTFYGYKHATKLRLDFIDWCINKFKNQ